MGIHIYIYIYNKPELTACSRTERTPKKKEGKKEKEAVPQIGEEKKRQSLSSTLCLQLHAKAHSSLSAAVARLTYSLASFPPRDIPFFLFIFISSFLLRSCAFDGEGQSRRRGAQCYLH